MPSKKKNSIPKRLTKKKISTPKRFTKKNNNCKTKTKKGGSNNQPSSWKVIIETLYNNLKEKFPIELKANNTEIESDIYFKLSRISYLMTDYYKDKCISDEYIKDIRCGLIDDVMNQCLNIPEKISCEKLIVLLRKSEVLRSYIDDIISDNETPENELETVPENEEKSNLIKIMIANKESDARSLGVEFSPDMTGEGLELVLKKNKKELLDEYLANKLNPSQTQQGGGKNSKLGMAILIKYYIIDTDKKVKKIMNKKAPKYLNDIETKNEALNNYINFNKLFYIFLEKEASLANKDKSVLQKKKEETVFNELKDNNIYNIKEILDENKEDKGPLKYKFYRRIRILIIDFFDIVDDIDNQYNKILGKMLGTTVMLKNKKKPLDPFINYANTERHNPRKNIVLKLEKLMKNLESMENNLIVTNIQDNYRLIRKNIIISLTNSIVYLVKNCYLDTLLDKSSDLKTKQIQDFETPPSEVQRSPSINSGQMGKDWTDA